MEDLLHLGLDRDFLRAIGPFENRSDALARLGDDRAGDRPERMSAQGDLFNVLALQPLQGAQRNRGVLVENIDPGADQRCTRELRQIAAQVLLEIANRRHEHVVDVDDLEIRVRDQHCRAGVIESGADAAADRRCGTALLFLQAPQLRLHLIEREQHLAGFVGPGELDAIVVTARGDRLEDRDGVRHRVDHRPGDEPAEGEAEADHDRQQNAVEGSAVQLGLQAVVELRVDGRIGRVRQIRKGHRRGRSGGEDVRALGGQALRLEQLRMQCLAEAIELLNGLAERGQDDSLHLGRVGGDGSELGVHLLEPDPCLVLVGEDGLAVPGADVAGQRGSGRTQARRTHVIHDIGGDLGGGADQVVSRSAGVERESGIHPDLEVQLQDFIDQRVVLRHVFRRRELAGFGLQVTPRRADGVPLTPGAELGIELGIDLIDGLHQSVDAALTGEDRLFLTGVPVEQDVSDAPVVENFSQQAPQGLEVARTVQLGAGDLQIVADRTEIECAGQNGRNQQSCDQDREFLPKLQAAEQFHTANPCELYARWTERA